MSRSRGQSRKNWNAPKRYLKEATKSRARAKEREAISRFLRGEANGVELSRHKDYDDIWNYD